MSNQAAARAAKGLDLLKSLDLLDEEEEKTLTEVISKQLLAQAKELFKGKSTYAVEIRKLIVKLAVSTSKPILITGESGTGKDVLARIVAAHSPKYNYIAVNCAAIPDTLFESEFFGHLQGAFTGAVRERKGYLEQVGNGILFLDEVGDMPLAQQAKLLRVLEDRKFKPVGSNEDKTFTARIVCATNKSLDRVSETMRLDFFERISTFEVNLEPLRDHLEDLVEITDEDFAKFVIEELEKVKDSSQIPLRGNARQAIRLYERYKVLGKDYIKPQHLF